VEIFCLWEMYQHISPPVVHLGQGAVKPANDVMA
jgi:hypothetical protein